MKHRVMWFARDRFVPGRYHPSFLKKFSLLALLLCFALVAMPAVAEVHVDVFHSPSLDRDRSVQVYLPPGYDPELSGGYPVVYFLHGMNGNHQSPWYEVVNSQANSLITAGLIEPMILVKPDGSTPFLTVEGFFDFGGSGWLDSELYGDFETYVVFDVPNYIEATYNASLQAERRAIMGHSMGAYGAMNAALKHPERYHAVASLSGPLDFAQFVTWFGNVINESPGFNYHPAHGDFSQASFMFAGGCSPNLSNPPFFVDFPLDAAGQLVPSVFNDRWLPRGCVASASALPPGTSLKIYFDCGTLDEFQLMPFNTNYVTALEGLGFTQDANWAQGETIDGDFVYWEFVGDHGSYISSQARRALRFINSSLLVPLATDDPRSGYGARLRGTRPNPFNPITTVDYELSGAGPALLQVFDLRGRLVRTLVNESLTAGRHEAPWDGRDAGGRELPSAVYVSRLEAGGTVAMGRMTLVR
jgi:pimeloyl-ACP methyl ester carboxylesterase